MIFKEEKFGRTGVFTSFAKESSQNQNSADTRRIISNVWEIILQKSKLINIPHNFQRRKEKRKKIW